MDSDKVSKAVNQAILKGVFPGAVLLCAMDQKIVFFESYGLADVFEKKQMTKDSIFDLASLTKPLATTLAVSKLIEKEQIFLDQNIGSILKEFKTSVKADITIDMLLRHRSGLPSHRQYFKKIIKSKDDPKKHLRKLLVQENLENRIDQYQVYSDLGFMILAWIIEKTSLQRLDDFVFHEIYSPLEINGLFFVDLNQKKESFEKHQKQMVPTQKCPWRKKILKGEVDDDNAWSIGGIDGHAGLFGDAVSIYALCCEILNALQGKSTKVLSSDIMKTLVKKKKQDDMAAGFDTPSKKDSSAGRFFSPSSVGHLGFTGTSFWIDPVNSVIIIFLTNRVHPLRSNQGIKKFRPQIHDLIYLHLIENIVC